MSPYVYNTVDCYYIYTYTYVCSCILMYVYQVTWSDDYPWQFLGPQFCAPGDTDVRMSTRNHSWDPGFWVCLLRGLDECGKPNAINHPQVITILMGNGWYVYHPQMGFPTFVDTMGSFLGLSSAVFVGSRIASSGHSLLPE